MNLIEHSPWHAGERQMQVSAGAAERMDMIGAKVIRDHLPEQHRGFYPLLPYLMLGVVDAHGMPWATMIEGAPDYFDFAVGEAAIAPEFAAAVAPVREWLSAHPDDRVQLSGFTDPTGDPGVYPPIGLSEYPFCL